MTGTYIKVVYLLGVHFHFRFKASYVHRAFKKINTIFAHVHQSIILEKAFPNLINFAVGSIHVFHFSSEVLIQFADNADLLIHGVK